MKLREDRQLLARFLVIQQSHPNMVDKLGNTIGYYEATVTPISPFATNGTLLIPSDNSSFMKEVERYSPPPLSKLGNNHSTTAVCDHAAPIDPEPHSRANVVIVDGQIPLHVIVIDVATKGTSIRDIYVWSPDTDVFLLLMDLVANCTIHE